MSVEQTVPARRAPAQVMGLRRLVARLRQRGVTEVAIERPDVPVVDALLEAELTVFVIEVCDRQPTAHQPLSVLAADECSRGQSHPSGWGTQRRQRVSRSSQSHPPDPDRHVASHPG